MAIDIVDFPIKSGGSFHSYVSLPEGTNIMDNYNVVPPQAFCLLV